MVCQKCGHDNELGRIFCHGCGTKLDLDSMAPPKVLKTKNWRRGPWGVLRRILDVVILLAVATMGYLLWQVAEVPTTQLDNAMMVVLDNKRMDLDMAEATGKARTIVLTGGEVNAFFAGLGFGKGDGKGFELVPQRIQATLGEGRVTVVLVDKLQFGSSFSKELSFTFIGRPVVRGGEFRWEPTGGALGKLPLHPQLVSVTGFTEQLLGGALRTLTHEKQLLDKLQSIVVEPGKVTLKSAGR